jgi:hypothetical protein
MDHGFESSLSLKRVDQRVRLGPRRRGSQGCDAVQFDAFTIALSRGVSVAIVMSVVGFVHPSATGRRSSRKNICTNLGKEVEFN